MTKESSEEKRHCGKKKNKQNIDTPISQTLTLCTCLFVVVAIDLFVRRKRKLYCNEKLTNQHTTKALATC